MKQTQAKGWSSIISKEFYVSVLGSWWYKERIATADIQSSAMYIQVRPENTKKRKKGQKEKSKSSKYEGRGQDITSWQACLFR